MKIYRLAIRRDWLAVQQEREFLNQQKLQHPSNLSHQNHTHYSTHLRLDALFSNDIKPVRFCYSGKMDEVINYCVKHQDACQDLYPTLEKLGLYYGRNSYNKDDVKFTQALKEALTSERAILLEKPIEYSSGMLPPQTDFLQLSNERTPRKLTTEEVKAREQAFYIDEDNWIEFSINDCPNLPFTLFHSASHQLLYQGKLDRNGYAYVKLPPRVGLVDVVWGNQDEYRPWYYDMPLQLLGGVLDAGQNSLDLLAEGVQARVKLDRADDYLNPVQVLFEYFTRQDDKQTLAETIAQQNKTVHANNDLFANPITLPDVDAPSTMSGALTRGVSQFLSGFILGYRIIRPITKMGSLTKGMVAGVIADSVVMSPNEARVSNFIESFPQLSNDITQYLQAKPDDSEAEGRLKNALEGLLLGIMLEPFMRSLRLLKYARIKFMIKEVRTKVHHRLSVTYDEAYNIANIEKLAKQLEGQNLSNMSWDEETLAKAIMGDKEKLNFGIGSATANEADRLGKIWVGDGYKISSDGGYISADGTRGYRPPVSKFNTPKQFNPTGIQANFETYRFDIDGNRIKVNNGHLIITE